MAHFLGDIVERLAPRLLIPQAALIARYPLNRIELVRVFHETLDALFFQGESRCDCGRPSLFAHRRNLLCPFLAIVGEGSVT